MSRAHANKQYQELGTMSSLPRDTRRTYYLLWYCLGWVQRFGLASLVAVLVTDGSDLSVLVLNRRFAPKRPTPDPFICGHCRMIPCHFESVVLRHHFPGPTTSHPHSSGQTATVLV
ncbi:hypothetical protein BR93DRAFT_829426 [Coniochaeta sp. PMI_546]|nr:hypothetical protein BR93DRAFT_829426 [Coniochaeta sp. PMI_546]